MTNTTQQADLEQLVRGQPLPRERFLAILGDPEARKKLRQMLLVHELFEPAPELDLDDLPETDVTLEELTAYLDNNGRLDDPDREQVVRELLDAEMPDLFVRPDPSQIDTSLLSSAETETVLTENTDTAIDPNSKQRGATGVGDETATDESATDADRGSDTDPRG